VAGVKQQVIQMIQALPDEATVDDIMAELYFRLQVDAGLRELDEGKGIPHEEVEKRMSRWLTK
jgi:predicted transcriptional regulator